MDALEHKMGVCAKPRLIFSFIIGGNMAVVSAPFYIENIIYL